MNKTSNITIAVVIIIVIILGAILMRKPSTEVVPPVNDTTVKSTQTTPSIPSSSSTTKSPTPVATAPVATETLSPALEATLRAQVLGFGSKLKNVYPLVQADSATQMESQYKPYLTPEFLLFWQNDPSLALGRTTPGQVPERISIVSIKSSPNGTYSVLGDVVEVNSTGSETVAIYPVVLTLSKRGSAWLISGVLRGAAPSTKLIAFEGGWECLSSRVTTRVVECSYGIGTSKNLHYAVDMRLLKNGPVSFPSGTRVRVEGSLAQPNDPSSGQWQQYVTDGVIIATGITKI